MTETPIQEEQASIKNRQSKVYSTFPFPSSPVPNSALWLMSTLVNLSGVHSALVLMTSLQPEAMFLSHLQDGTAQMDSWQDGDISGQPP